ncbi:MAG: NAD(P)/FAD-dependent oxidoreductase [Lutimonas sp.]
MNTQAAKEHFSDVLIIGGGLAGLCSAIDLSGKGLSVVVIEKDSFPRHKVCGEYVSNETLPYLSSLGIDPFELGAVRIDQLDFSVPDKSALKTSLPLGGFGISRFHLDHALSQKAEHNGARIIQDQVENVDFNNDQFQVRTKKRKSYSSRFVIGAFGKRSVLDKKLDREFIKKKSSYVAVKAHYKGNYPENLVGLYNFEGGYCGVSNVEDSKINICYIVDYRVFQQFKNITAFQDQVLRSNKDLNAILESSEMVFEKPLSISQISFDDKELVVDHVLMCGDSAGLIHPLCGNGMGMAIGAARLVSEAILSYFNGKLKTREEVEKQYIQLWNKSFKSRLRTGHTLALLLKNYKMTSFLMPLLQSFPVLLRNIIRATHGKAAFAI